MEELYTLGFEGQLTSKGRDELFKAMKWDYWDEDPYLGGWYVHCEAPTTDRERYDDLIVVNACGSASMRADKQFNASRKCVTTHQRFMVFAKGDPKKATNRIKGE